MSLVRSALFFGSEFYTLSVVPNVWMRPPNMRKEADQAKKMLEVPDGDHLTLLNVYNHYSLSTFPLFITALIH